MVSIQVKPWGNLDGIPWLTRMFEAIVTPCSMQTITIELDGGFWVLNNADLAAVSAALDAAVARPEFGELQTVSVVVRFTQPRTEEEQRGFKIAMTNMFPLLHQRGLLEVQEKLQGEGYVVIVESRSNSQWILFNYLIAEFGRRWPGIASSLS